jgi:hypothetical protein
MTLHASASGGHAWNGGAVLGLWEGSSLVCPGNV